MSEAVVALTKGQIARVYLIHIFSQLLFVAWMVGIIITGESSKLLNYVMYGAIVLFVFMGPAAKDKAVMKRLQRHMQWFQWLVVVPVAVLLVVLHPSYWVQPVLLVGILVILPLIQPKLDRWAEAAEAEKAKAKATEAARSARTAKPSEPIDARPPRSSD